MPARMPPTGTPYVEVLHAGEGYVCVTWVRGRRDCRKQGGRKAEVSWARVGNSLRSILTQ